MKTFRTNTTNLTIVNELIRLGYILTTVEPISPYRVKYKLFKVIL